MLFLGGHLLIALAPGANFETKADPTERLFGGGRGGRRADGALAGLVKAVRKRGTPGFLEDFRWNYRLCFRICFSFHFRNRDIYTISDAGAVGKVSKFARMRAAGSTSAGAAIRLS